MTTATTSASAPGEPIVLQGSCFCKRTTYTLRTHDDAVGSSNLTFSCFCHCSHCQRNNGAPFIHTTHWKAGAVTWGGELPLRFESKPRKFKLACGSCRSPVGTWNERKQEWSIWPSTLERDPTTLRVIGREHMLPTAHTYYGEWRQVDVYDGLPKWSGNEGESERVD